MNWVNKFITPSRIDMFAKYQSGYEYQFGEISKEFTTDEFINKLLGLQNPDDFIKANAGTAVHKLFEDCKYGELLSAYKVNDWIISIDSKLECEIYIPDMREVWVNSVIANVPIRGRVDSIDCLAIHDLKTTKYIDINNYINSWQWKIYCVMCKLDNFVYDIFKVNVKEEEKKVILQEYYKLELSTYPGINLEVENIICEYKICLLKLSERIIERIDDYNNQLDILVSKLEESLTWAHTANIEIKNAINKIKQKQLIIKGVNHGSYFYKNK